MKSYDELDNNYVTFEKLSHRRVGSGQRIANHAKKTRQLKRIEKLRLKRLGRKKAIRFKIVRISKPRGPRYNGTLQSIGEILKFYGR